MKYLFVVVSFSLFSCSKKSPINTNECKDRIDTIGWNITYAKSSSAFDDVKIVSSVPVLDTIQDTICEWTMSRKIKCFECGKLLCTLENGSTIIKSGLRAFCVPDCKEKNHESVIDSLFRGFQKWFFTEPKLLQTWSES